MVATGWLALGHVPVGGAGTNGWPTFYPVHLPVTLKLPADCVAAAPPQGTRFYAQTPLGDAQLTLNVAPYQGSASSFVTEMYAKARQVYLAQDPKASIRSRRIGLPAGHGFEVITTLVRRAGS